MRKIILTTVLSALVFGYCGFVIGKSTMHHITKKKHVITNAVTVPIVVDQTKSLCLLFADSVDGRPTFTVMFNDTTVLDAMYPEEIANGLLSGKWEYDEDIKLSN
jgi:hypothetical protein